MLRSNWYQYCHLSKIIILATGLWNLSPFRLKWSCQYTELPHINLKNWYISVKSDKNHISQITKADIRIASIYKTTYILQLDRNAGMLHCLTLNDSFVTHFSTLNLQGKGSFVFNVWDNLLLCFNLEAKHVFLFDFHSTVPSDPIISSFLDFKSLMPHIDAAQSPLQISSAAQYLHITPNVYELNLDLSLIINTIHSIAPETMLEFIIRRQRALPFSIRTQILHDALLNEISQSTLRYMFDILIQDCSKRNIPYNPRDLHKLPNITLPRSTSSGSFKKINEVPTPTANIVSSEFQHDIVQSVFEPLSNVFFPLKLDYPRK